jgi:hypothetical protein
MCFASKPPTPPPPQPLQGTGEPAAVKTAQSKRDQLGITSQGTSSLRIPINAGSTTGGLNI